MRKKDAEEKYKEKTATLDIKPAEISYKSGEQPQLVIIFNSIKAMLNSYVKGTIEI